MLDGTGGACRIAMAACRNLRCSSDFAEKILLVREYSLA
jgi:hypothetical protein